MRGHIWVTPLYDARSVMSAVEAFAREARGAGGSVELQWEDRTNAVEKAESSAHPFFLSALSALVHPGNGQQEPPDKTPRTKRRARTLGLAQEREGFACRPDAPGGRVLAQALRELASERGEAEGGPFSVCGPVPHARPARRRHDMIKTNNN